jgi:hypothetical protein
MKGFDRYGNLYANDTICRRFLKLGFPFVVCHGSSHCDSTVIFYELPYDVPNYDVSKAYFRPLLTTINDWLEFGNLEERQTRDESLENKFNTLIEEGLL